VTGAFTHTALFWILSAGTLAGALYVVLAREVMSVVLGLGTVLLGLAGLFAYFGFGFLALAQLFLYVGGVLVLFLFAIMLIHRSDSGTPSMANRPDPLFIAASSALGLLVLAMLSPAAPKSASVAGAGGPSQIAGVLLGEMLPQFEAVGVLLLIALVVVVLVMAGDRRWASSLSHARALGSGCVACWFAERSSRSSRALRSCWRVRCCSLSVSQARCPTRRPVAYMPQR